MNRTEAIEAMDYKIENLRYYPDDGKHQKCFTKLPFTITKGSDSFLYHERWDSKEYKEYNRYKDFKDSVDQRWIAVIKPEANESLKAIYLTLLHKDLDKVLEKLKKIYLASLKKELVRIKKELKSYGG